MEKTTKFPIGEASQRTGVKVPTIRYYEQIGLLPVQPRTEGNRRLYADADLRRLAFIRHGRELGFELDAIRSLLALQGKRNQSCERACGIARTHLEEVEGRIRTLQALRGELRAMLENGEHGKIGRCRVIEVVADHGKCRTPDHRNPRPGRRAAPSKAQRASG